MKRPIKLVGVGIVLIATAFAFSRFCLRAQQSPDADWTVTQKRMTNIARALVQRQNDTWSQQYRDRWPCVLQPRELHYGKVDMVFRDEWDRPFVYRPYGDTSDPYAYREKCKRLPAKLIGEQFLDLDHPKGGEWTPGEGGWEPDEPGGWMRKNPDGSSTHTGIGIEYIDIVSLGKDGRPGGDGENKDMVLRMHDHRDSDWKQKRIGGEWSSTRRISWRFLNR